MTSTLKLDSQSAILEEAVGSRLMEKKREPCEMSFADFDDVLFKLTVVPGAESVMTLNMALPYYDAVVKQGGKEIIEKIYGSQATAPEAGYQFALTVDCDKVAEQTRSTVLDSWMNIKRNVIGAPFVMAFEALTKGTAKDLPLIEVPMRKTESAYLVAAKDPANPNAPWDQIKVVLSIDFNDESDRAYARIFLQGFVDCCRKVNNAPPIQFYEPKNPPAEIKDKVSMANSNNVLGYLTFTIFDRHVKTPEKLTKTVDSLIGFRNYLHFHIKAAKTNLHMRMRRKVLNRAVLSSTVPKDMKTASGKTFTRKT